MLNRDAAKLSAKMAAAPLLKFTGHDYLRHRLVLSVLSGKPVRIDRIRSDDKDPGLKGSQPTHASPILLFI